MTGSSRTASPESRMILQLARPVRAGDFLIGSDRDPVSPMPWVALPMPAHEMRFGRYLIRKSNGRPVLQAKSRVLWPGASGNGPTDCWIFNALEDTTAGSHELAGPIALGISLAWITLSDKGAAGKRVDTSGPAIRQTLETTLELSDSMGFVIPDDIDRLRALVMDLTRRQGVDLVITTGGTGLAPRDQTPEAVINLLERRLPGFEQAMTAVSLTKTPHAMISRAVCGAIQGSILISLPGSPKAVKENLQAVLPALPHALAKLHGDPADCARP